MVLSPIGLFFAETSSSSSRISCSSKPRSFTPSSSSAYFARFSVTSVSLATSEKSLTRFRRRSAIRGVPLLRLAISCAASGMEGFSSLCAAWETIFANSSGV